MSQQFRLLLKAVALCRYMFTKNRIDKVSVAAKQFVAGKNTVGDVAKEFLPVSKEALQDNLKLKRLRKKIWLYLCFLTGVSAVSYEYHKHLSYVPITNRKHFVIIPRSLELSYQQLFLDTLAKKYEHCILEETSPSFCFVQSILNNLINACIYFSPECEEYMKHIKIILVDSEEVNAYTTMGSIIVINTGLIHQFEKLKEEGQNINVEECMAGVLAHELAHSLSRHPAEAMLRWTGWAYYIYITFVPDLILMPIIKGLFDKKTSRSQEHEADVQALYLLKRSGYDPSSLIKTLSLLPDDEDDFEIISFAKEQVDDHPRLRTRILYLQDRIFWFEKDFNNRFTVNLEKENPHDSFLSSLLSFLHFGLFCVSLANRIIFTNIPSESSNVIYISMKTRLYRVKCHFPIFNKHNENNIVYYLNTLYSNVRFFETKRSPIPPSFRSR